MRRHWEYMKYVLRHKLFVLIAGLQLGVPPGTLIVHDWDKFLPFMWFAYARCFYKPNGEKQYVESVEFNVAWNAHQKRNKHHWQYWMLVYDSGKTECLVMPDKYRREMLADWIGAGRALGKPNTWEWYEANKGNIQLHTVTRFWIEKQLEQLRKHAELEARLKGMGVI